MHGVQQNSHKWNCLRRSSSAQVTGLLLLALCLLGGSSAVQAGVTDPTLIVTGAVLGEAAHDEHHGKEGDHHAGGEPAGPITAKTQDIDLGIWTLVTFVVFMLVLTKAAWKPLSEALDKRERSIRDDLAAAEDARFRAEKLLADHQATLADTQNQVRAMLDEARRDAEQTRASIVSAAQTEAEQAKNRALAEIEQARNEALNDLFGVMSKTVMDATETVLGRSITGEDHQRLIRDSLDQLRQQKA